MRDEYKHPARTSLQIAYDMFIRPVSKPFRLALMHVSAELWDAYHDEILNNAHLCFIEPPDSTQWLAFRNARIIRCESEGYWRVRNVCLID